MGRILPDLTADISRYMPASKPRASLPRGGGRPIKFPASEVARLVQEGLTNDQMCDRLGCSLATLMKRKHELGLVNQVRSRAKRGEGGAGSRFRPKLRHGPATMPPVDHPAFTEARTLQPASVVPVEGRENILVDGMSNWKIGGRISKGRWRGFKVYTLTLEERATCPTSCAHWRSCYGNHMNLAKRVAHGPSLERRLQAELDMLSFRHPAGFAVRLHVLGDFYSVAYVEQWREWLDRFPALHVFGFTARWQVDRDPIAAALVALVRERWERFSIRFSNAPIDECSTVSIEHPLQRPDDAVVCPQQTGRTDSCSTCGFCWHSRRRVAFVRH